jgi:ATP-binding cassette subfamily B protein
MPRRVRTRDMVSAGVFAIRLTWQADRNRLLGVLLVQFVSAAGLGGFVLLTRDLLGGALASGGDEPTAGTERLIPALAGLVVIGSVSGMLRLLSQGWQQILGLQLDRNIIASVLRSSSRADLTTFERPEFHDRLQRAVFASRSQPMFLVATLSAALQAVLGLVAVGVTFAVMAWWLLPLCALSVLPIIKTARDERNARYGLHVDLAENRRVREYLERVLTGRDEAKEVRAFGLGQKLRERWAARYQAEIDRTTAMQGAHIRRRSVARLLSDLVTVAVIGAMWWLVHTGPLPLSTALAALTALWLLSTRVQLMGYLLNNIGENVLYLLDLRTFSVPDIAETASPAVPLESLRLERVDFAYPESDRTVLHDVTVTLKAGEIVALVGLNGSGKTTLAKLLAGLYEPDSGRLLYNGEPVDDPTVLQESTAVLFQDFVRYKLSALDNITFGRPEAPVRLEHAQRAARYAGAHDFLSALPEGYETLLAKEFAKGVDLSLGQWQRLALARAFYRDAPFVILDEPTASLDPQAEAELFERIRELFAGRTVLLISHRFSSVRSADRIYVLDEGRLIEHGTHESLLAGDGTYARLFNLQAKAYLEPAGSGS